MVESGPSRAPSAEMRLLVLAARVGTGERDLPALRAAVEAVDDWGRFERMAHDHRLVPFVADALSAVPECVPEATIRRLIERRVTIARRAHRALEEGHALQARLAEAGIASLMYKGPLLAYRAYGDASMRECLDIDLVVAPRDLARAAAVLMAADLRIRDDRSLRVARTVNEVFGQIPFEPRGDPERFDVDLHWRFCNRALPWSPPFADVFARSALVELDGRRYVAPVTTEELLLQLLHVARHQWRSLEWVLLVRALLRDPAVDGEALLAAAERGVRGRRAVLIGCEVARLMLGATLPTAIATALDEDDACRTFAAEVTRTVLGREELGARERGWLLRALDTRRDRVLFLAGEIAIPTPREADWIGLPDALAPLYWPIRWIRLLARAVRGGPDADAPARSLRR